MMSSITHLPMGLLRIFGALRLFFQPSNPTLSVIIHDSPRPNSDTAETSELLTKKELAHRLRVSDRKIEPDRDMPRIRWGRTIRFDWQEVLHSLRQGDLA